MYFYLVAEHLGLRSARSADDEIELPVRSERLSLQRDVRSIDSLCLVTSRHDHCRTTVDARIEDPGSTMTRAYTTQGLATIWIPVTPVHPSPRSPAHSRRKFFAVLPRKITWLDVSADSRLVASDATNRPESQRSL